jgi:hypothetical protein
MKKKCVPNSFTFFLICALYFFSFVSIVWAEENKHNSSFTITIVITTAKVEIEGPGPYVEFSPNKSVFPGIDQVSQASAGVKNIGSGLIRLQVKAELSETASNTGWVQAALPYANPALLPSKTYAVYGIFANPDPASIKNIADFGEEDFLTPSLLTATETALARPADRISATANGQTIYSYPYAGFNVPTGQWRNLFFRVQLPQNVAKFGELAVDMTIVASAN